MKTIHLIIVLAIACAQIPPVLATNYYVDYTLGSDAPTQGTAPGTDAFKTLGYALGNSTDPGAFPGPSENDKIILAPATHVCSSTDPEYYPIVLFTANRVTITSNGQGSVIFDASNGGENPIFRVETDANVISNLSFRNNSESATFIDTGTGNIFEGLNFSGNQELVDYTGTMVLTGSGAEINQCFFDNNEAGFGGAIYCEDSFAQIHDSTFGPANLTRPAGGAIYLLNSSANIRHNVFRSNLTYGKGGAIYASGGTPRIYKGNAFVNDSGLLGGAIYLTNTDPETLIDGNSFVSETATDSGVIYCDNTQATISNNTFEACNASQAGGGIMILNSQMDIEGNEFSNCTAVQGGGINIEDQNYNEITINQNSFSGCSAKGSALNCTGNFQATIQDNLIYNNGSTVGYITINFSQCKNGPGPINIVHNEIYYNNGNSAKIIYFSSNTTPVLFSGNNIFSNNGDALVVSQCTNLSIEASYFVNQWGADSTGIYLSDCDSSTRILNCTLAGNGRYGIYAHESPDIIIANCILYDNAMPDVEGAYPSYCCIEDGIAGVNHNITDDPCFIDLAANDCHIQNWSPCIDRGRDSPIFPQFDYDGDSYGFDSQSCSNDPSSRDIGADEITSDCGPAPSINVPSTTFSGLIVSLITFGIFILKKFRGACINT